MAVYRNPKIYVTTPEPTPWDRLQRKKRIAAGIFVAVFSVGLFWLLFFSPTFAVSDTIVEGPATADVQTRFEEFVGRNIFRLDAERLEAELKADHPHIKNIVIYRGLPNALKIVVVTREEAMVWESGGRQYLVDFEGVPFMEITNPIEQDLAQSLENIVELPATSSYPELPLIIDTQGATVTVGTPLVTPDFVQFALTIHRDFLSTTSVGLRTLQVGETTFHLTTITDQNFSVFFDTTRNAERQLLALKRLLGTNRNSVTEYIDLRIAGRAYVK